MSTVREMREGDRACVMDMMRELRIIGSAFVDFDQTMCYAL